MLRSGSFLLDEKNRGWLNTIYCGYEWLVVPLIIVCDLGAQAVLQRRVFLTSCLRGGQLADQEDRSEERGNLCFGLESLIQPLTRISAQAASAWGDTACISIHNYYFPYKHFMFIIAHNDT